jgi:hypothetical protein
VRKAPAEDTPCVRYPVLSSPSGAGKPWAAGRSARKARRHRRTRSGQVVRVPEGVPIPPDQAVTVGEVEAAGIGVDERTALLSGSEQVAEGGAGATDV